MKILSSQQMHQADSYTIANEPIASIDLMERAANQFCNILLEKQTNDNYYIFCGKGNNGGDGLAIARMLVQAKKKVTVIIINHTKSVSNDFKVNYERLKKLDTLSLTISEVDIFKTITIPDFAIIIDGIFGSGLNRPISGLAAEYIIYCNKLKNKKYAIDVPSGLYADIPIEPNATVFHADETITFQAPKLQCMFAENSQFVGNLTIADIHIRHPFSNSETPFEYITRQDIQISKRNIFAHKGTFGHALLVAGSYGKMGAAILASKSCLRTGCGLLTTHSPKCGLDILQCSIPEAMVSIDNHQKYVSNIPNTNQYTAIGIGPGIDTKRLTAKTLRSFLETNQKPVVLDADALNIIAQHPELWEFVKPNSIITPHPGEFDRLTKPHTSGYERFLTQIKFAKKHSCIVIVKGHYTSIATSSGNVYFNSTGNPGMATAGSGDTLTGIILSLLAQQYEPIDAAKFGVFLHGLAGDIAEKEKGASSLIASDIIEHLSDAISYLSHQE